MSVSIAVRMKEEARRLGFEKVGIARAARTPVEQQRLENWLDQGLHASMAWLEKRREERGNLFAYFPEAKSVISVGLNYFTGFDQNDLNSGYHFSNYAWGADYHAVVKSKLFHLRDWLQLEYPELKGLVCVDTAPVMDKIWAQRAGLGWVGKHTNLISREYGSWLFLGELIVDVELPYDSEFSQDLCGTCTACIDACPTNALTDYQLDAGKCISYLTIEHWGAFSQETPPLQQWIYGCDICQEVCPWNRKFAQRTHLEAFQPRPEILTWNDRDWERLDEEGFRKLFRNSAVKRTKFDGLKRNISINRFSRKDRIGKHN
jgi:epoxyqueuosine reductase